MHPPRTSPKAAATSFPRFDSEIVQVRPGVHLYARRHNQRVGMGGTQLHACRAGHVRDGSWCRRGGPRSANDAKDWREQQGTPVQNAHMPQLVGERDCLADRLPHGASAPAHPAAPPPRHRRGPLQGGDYLGLWRRLQMAQVARRRGGQARFSGHGRSAARLGARGCCGGGAARPLLISSA